jgi:CO/xanthine dehydrogenase FAD-binding subunit
MITAIHKPDNLEDALTLLARDVDTRPLAGGTVLNAPHDAAFEVVDLSKLGLDTIEAKGSSLIIGATATLQSLLDTDGIPADLAKAIALETTRNLRHMASVAGTLVSDDGRSPFAAALLALDAALTIHPGPEDTSIGAILPLRGDNLKGKLITSISLSTAPRFGFEYVARSPADRPVLIVALAQWESGRTRIALGGWGSAPALLIDGRDPSGAADAAENALLSATDQWASAEYRTDAAITLINRLLETR